MLARPQTHPNPQRNPNDGPGRELGAKGDSP
jgi:hypothetical protein